MKKIKQENGVTLVILLVMIIILLILASIGVTSWNQAIEYSNLLNLLRNYKLCNQK